jgi:hypothetical protein
MQAYLDDNIKRKLQGVNWIRFTQDKWAIAVINIWVQYNRGIY